jgi:hypothetical protein
MGLLDDDVRPPMPARGKWYGPARGFQVNENFEDLQNLGHKENSQDFSDSPFADRREDERAEGDA